jgi:hypothetical protein
LKRPLGLTGEHRNAQVPACIEVNGAAVKHRHTAGHVKSAGCDRDAGGTERAGNIEGAWLLVRVDANKCNEPEIAVTAVTAKPIEQSGDGDARMRLVSCLDSDRNVRPEDLAFCASAAMP